MVPQLEPNEPDRHQPDREQLVREILDELASYGPTGAMRHLRRFPGGPLSLVHLHVLSVLESDGDVPMGALAESLDVSQASATGIVDRMEQRGLVERRRDAQDRRVIRVALTDGGRDVLTRLVAARREHLNRFLEELSAAELEGFLLGTRALHRARAQYLATHAQDLHTTPTKDAHGGTNPVVGQPEREATR